jgi:hypothetical protein
MKKGFNFVSLLVVVLLFFGCGATRNQMTEQENRKGIEKETGIVNEFFDPLILKEDELKVKKTISIESKSDQMKENDIQTMPESQRSDETSGFRVQICAVSDEGRARQIQREAILKFMNEEVYLIYDSPYYKVRVGNCMTRFEADKLQQLAVEKGFDDAWVVRTKISMKSQQNTSDKMPYDPQDY